MSDSTEKIGILRGMETSFPEGLISTINSRAEKMSLPVKAEMVTVGGVKMGTPTGYKVIIDRISHEVPFYRAFVKEASLAGTEVINNPFWWSADDKFFNYSLAAKLGVSVPKTLLLPHYAHPPNTEATSFRNLEYPLNWDDLFEYVGFPAFLKPFDGGGWRHVYKVDNADEFFENYAKTGELCMVLQSAVRFQQYYRCYCIGKKDVLIMEYDPGAEQQDRYVKNPKPLDPKMKKRLERDCITITQSLGYDINTIEFAVEDGVPYAIDYMNPAPDCDYNSVTPPNYEWVVDKVTALAIERAMAKDPAVSDLRWSAFLTGRIDKKPPSAGRTRKKIQKK